LYHKYEKKFEDKSVKNLVNAINNPSPAFAGDRLQVHPKEFKEATGGNESARTNNARSFTNQYPSKPFVLPPSRDEPDMEPPRVSQAESGIGGIDRFGSLKNQSGVESIIGGEMSTDDMLKAMGV
jgi:hypothetical protein